MSKRSKTKSAKENQDIRILVDGSSVAYGAFHAIGHLGLDGRKTGVIYGFLNKLLLIADTFKTNDFIICWDAGVSFRHHAYPHYKERRWQKRQEASEEDKKERESLLWQMVQLNHDIMPNLGFKNNFIQLNFEADDLLAFLVNKYHKKKRLIMVTTDADMFQCLDKCDIWFPTKKKLFTKEDMIKKYGTPPDKWAMAKAIGGCSGDGVAGIVGVSDPKNPKSKVHKYLRGELNKGVILDRIESREGQDIIKRNLPLVKLPYRQDMMKRFIYRRNYFTKRRFIREFSRLRFMSFIEENRLKKWVKCFVDRR